MANTSLKTKQKWRGCRGEVILPKLDDKKNRKTRESLQLPQAATTFGVRPSFNRCMDHMKPSNVKCCDIIGRRDGLPN